MLRPVEPADLDVFFENQRDERSVAMALVPARDREAFDAHWKKILADPETAIRTIDVDGVVVGNVLTFVLGGERMVGYWIGREHWGKGFASDALAEFLTEIDERPLYAFVAPHNAASVRVLEKAGFEVVGREPDEIKLVLR